MVEGTVEGTVEGRSVEPGFKRFTLINQIMTIKAIIHLAEEGGY
jgi:hypothetical protein